MQGKITWKVNFQAEVGLDIDALPGWAGYQRNARENHLKVNFRAEVGLDIRCPAGGQAIKEMAGKPSESLLSSDFLANSLSLLSDSNQRPRDYKSRALAN